MIFYWILLFFLIVLSLLANGSKKTSRQYLYGMLALFFCFFAFRIGFTPDYYGYENWFATEKWYGFDFKEYNLSSEILFSFMASHLPYRLGLILQTALICYALYYTFNNYIPVKYWTIAVLLFFLYHYFILDNISAYRSSYVTAAYFFAFVLRDRVKYGVIWGSLLIISSCLMHQAGIVMVVPYLLCTFKKYTKAQYVLLFIIATVLIIFMYTRVQEMNALASLMVEDNFSKFEAYMDNMKGDRSIHLTSLVYLYMFYYTASFLKQDLSKIEHIFVFQTCVFVMLLIMPSIGMLDRFQFHLMFPAVIGFVIIMKKSEGKSMKYAYLGSWAYLVFRSFYLFSQSDNYLTRWAFYDNILFIF